MIKNYFSIKYISNIKNRHVNQNFSFEFRIAFDSQTIKEGLEFKTG